MRLLAAFLSFLLLAGLVWAAPAPGRAASQAASASACEQEWQAMAQRHREQADAMRKESSGLRALLTMLRNDAGIVRDATVRDGRRVGADVGGSLLGGLQGRGAGLRARAKREESRRRGLGRPAKK